MPKSQSQNTGTLVHEWINKNGYRKLTGVERLMPVLGLTPKNKVIQEKKLVRELEDCYVVAIPDLCTKRIVVDWKTGRMTGYEHQMQLYMWMLGPQCQDAFLVHTAPTYTDGQLSGAVAGRVFQYKRAKDADVWEERFTTVAQEIYGNLPKMERYLALTGCNLAEVLV